MNNVIYYFHFDGNYYAGDHIDIHDNSSINFYQGRHFPETATNETCVEDVTPVDTSFFCTQQFTEDIIEKNLRQAIESASSKADADFILEKVGIRFKHVLIDEFQDTSA